MLEPSLDTPPSVLPDISPSRGEIASSAWLSPIVNSAKKAVGPKLLISPLEGEMSGRTERGAWAPSSEVGRPT